MKEYRRRHHVARQGHLFFAAWRLRVQDLDESSIDWSPFSLRTPEVMELRAKKTLRAHQTLALAKVHDGFQTHARGKLIMACGTGKTLTSLRIAENMVAPGGSVLLLVPSISLLSQTLKEWTTEATVGCTRGCGRTSPATLGGVCST